VPKISIRPKQITLCDCIKPYPVKSANGNLTSILRFVKEKYPSRDKKQKNANFPQINKKSGKIKMLAVLEIFPNFCETLPGSIFYLSGK
jgi:hypothetical protein